MKPFLSLVAHDLYTKLQGDLSHTVVVFPGKRAGLFFNQYLLAESGGKPLFAPTYTTLGELFGSLSDLRSDDHIRLVCLLHRHWVQATGRNESIDDFYRWGELLLSDFDDIDKNLVDADNLFLNLSNYKELSSSDYLTEEQREVLEKFFGGFRQSETNSFIRDKFLSIWQAMLPIYHAFRNGLEAEGLAYDGQLFRHAVEHFDPSRLTADKYVFVGFNVLSAVEQRLFDLVAETGKACFYWDYDHYYYDNPFAEAGTFLRQNIRHFGNELDEWSGSDGESLYDNLRRLRRIDIVSAPTNNAQASFAHDWIKANLTSPEQETAVVLADEALIMSLLHALPMDAIGDINVTMGLPMTETTVYPFLRTLVDDDEADTSSTQNALDWLRGIADAIDGKGLEMKRLEHRLQEEEEALYRAHLAVNGLIRQVSDGTLTGSRKLLTRLLMTILRGTTIPFHGEPARGLQVMGVLETRGLDFRHLLLLSANEDLLPKSPSEVSFIPFSLRKAFGLTTIERQTAVYAYYFYRMIQRAEEVTLVYNNGTDGMNQMEPSRFITQLEVEFDGEIRHFALQGAEPLVSTADHTIFVAQTPATRKKLAARFSGRMLSPSALNTYLKCKLRFYFRYVEGLRFDDDDTEDVTPSQFGTLFHRSAELAYKKLTSAGPVVQSRELTALAKDEAAIRRIVDQAFRDSYWKVGANEEVSYNGIQLINYKAITIYLKQLLLCDARHAPFVYEGGERTIDEPYTVRCGDGDLTIRLGGTIDRLDTKDGITRIIDYKTGTKDALVKHVDELFNKETDKTKKEYVFQAFYYAWLLCRKDGDRAYSPALFFTRHLGESDYDPVVKLAGKGITDFCSEAFDDFDRGMHALLDEIFNSDVPYTQAERVEACKYCDFCSICGRKQNTY